MREAQAFGYMDEKRNLLIHKPYDDAALVRPSRNYGKETTFLDEH